MKTIKKLLGIGVFILFVLGIFSPLAVQGDANPKPYQGSEMERQLNAFGGSNGAQLQSATDPRIVVARLIKIFLSVVGVVAVALGAYAGFLIMTSSGNEEKIDVGKKILLYCVSGVAVMLAAYSIVYFIYVGIYKSFENPASFGCDGGVYVRSNDSDLYNPDTIQEDTIQSGYVGDSFEWRCN